MIQPKASKTYRVEIAPQKQTLTHSLKTIRIKSTSMLAVSLAANLLLLLAMANQQTSVEAWWFQTTDPATIRAAANFDLDGVQGTFTFTQKSASEPTLVEYNLSGLKGNNKFYHVHVRPVPQFDAEKVRNNLTAIAELCADPATGGHHNPHNIKAKLPPKSAPFDQYEIGDLSGKHGPLVGMSEQGHEDHYVGSFNDDKLPLTGEHKIIGRSIVIHKNDGKRWVCASINEIK